jgi:hypothetical protein
LPKEETDDGSRIDFNPLPWKTEYPIPSNFENEAKCTDSRFAQFKKHEAPKEETDAGMLIDFNPLPWKTDWPRTLSFGSP